MKLKLFILLLMSLIFYSCKKDNPVKFSGILVFSNTLPVPVKNVPLELYQPGSASLIGGVSSSYADAVTDAKGHFTFSFSSGSGFVAGIPTSNSDPVTLSYGVLNNVDSLPQLYMRNFPYNGNVDTIYLCKKVDTVIIQITFSSAINPSDSFVINASNLTGPLTQIKTGITAAINTKINLDTVINGTFASFDFKTNQYQNDFLIQSPYGSPNSIGIDDVSPPLAKYDEQKITLSYIAY